MFIAVALVRQKNSASGSIWMLKLRCSSGGCSGSCGCGAGSRVLIAVALVRQESVITGSQDV